MKTEQLILQLTQDKNPKASFQPIKNWMLWTLAPISVMILRFFLWQRQSPDLTKNFDSSFFLESLLLALLFVLVPYLTFKQSVPGFKNLKITVLTSALFVGWIFLLIFRATATDLKEAQSDIFLQGMACSYEILLMALLPLALIFFVLKRGASVHPVRSGMMAATSATMMGTLVLQVICQAASSVHVLAFHFGAVFLISVIGAFLGTIFLRW